MASMDKSKSKLDKMSMPSKKKPLDDAMIMELEMEPGSEDNADEESSEDSDMSNEQEGEATGETDGALATASDDDLLAEVRRRGLSADAEMAASDETSSDSEYKS